MREQPDESQLSCMPFAAPASLDSFLVLAPPSFSYHRLSRKELERMHRLGPGTCAGASARLKTIALIGFAEINLLDADLQGESERSARVCVSSLVVAPPAQKRRNSGNNSD